MNDEFEIRVATTDDVPTLARYRCEMFKDMGRLKESAYQDLYIAAEQYFHHAIPSGEYLGFLAFLTEDKVNPIAGAGIVLRKIPPSVNFDGTPLIGKQALIQNVYTEKVWRKKGLANKLMAEVLQWCEKWKIQSVILHASHEARSIYEKIGFISTNEMRYKK